MKIPDFQRANRTVTVDASGDADVDIGPFRGWLERIIYTKDDFANGVDFTITDEDTGRTIWTEANVNSSKTVYSSDLVQDTGGSNTTQYDRIWIKGDVNVVVAQGGNATSGTFEIWCVGE